MNRREFIKNSIIAAGGAVFLGKTMEKGLLAAGSDDDKKKIAQLPRRKFNKITLPLLGMGCMRLPVKDGKPDIKAFEKMTEYAMLHGLNHFDTAWPYHGGNSETALAEVLSSFKRESYTISNKLPTWLINSKDDIKRYFETQLKKCRTKYFDLYLVHSLMGPSIETYRKQKIFEELLKYKEQGLIKNLGFSFHDRAEVLKDIVGEHPWDFCLLQINYLDWSLLKAREMYEIATKARLPVLVMEPLKGGALCSLVPAAEKKLKENFPDESQATFGLKWVAGRQNVSMMLSGMSNFEQLKENVDMFCNYKPLGKKGDTTAEEIVRIIQSSGEIPCTACRYCSDCPRGINIPAVFMAYNTYKKTGSRHKFVREAWDNLDEAERPDRCINCGLCMRHCPQKLEIPELLSMILKELGK